MLVRKLKPFKVILLGLGLRCSTCGAAMPPFPVTACTFYQSIWRAAFLGCAEPSVKPLSCTKVKQVGLVTVKYKGDLVAMYLPDFVIETTTGFGQSLFQNASALLAKHLAKAQDWQAKQTKASLGILENGGAQEKEQNYFWYARLLPVPFGGMNSYPNVRAGAGGNGLPVCFTGIAEFYPDQWLLGISDLPFAASWAPLGLPMCFTNAGIASSAAISAAQETAKKAAGDLIRSLTDIDISGYTSGMSCAHPISGKAGLTFNLKPGSDALDPSKVCMGGLGNLLPRTAQTLTHDKFRSSLAAAWRFSSLVSDFHPGSDSGMTHDDKWQIIYPQSSRPECFRAGQLSDIPTGPFENRRPDSIGIKDEAYLYAIWRERDACLEPGTGGAWRASVIAEHAALQAACGGM